MRTTPSAPHHFFQSRKVVAREGERTGQHGYPIRMTTPRMAIALIVALALGGCNYSYIEHCVTLIDGETRAPVQGALVSVTYMGFPYGPVVQPKPSSGITNDSGEVLLRATSTRDQSVNPIWFTEPAGYFRLPLYGDDYRAARSAIESAEAGSTGDVNVSLRVWAKPEPTIRVTLPAGYCGYVSICAPQQPPTGPQSRNRLFECTADARGRCELSAASILQHSSPRYEFQFADGVPCPYVGSTWEAKPGGMRSGAWHAGDDKDQHFKCEAFVIGSEARAISERTWAHRWSGSSPTFDEVAWRAAYKAWTERIHTGPFSAHEANP